MDALEIDHQPQPGGMDVKTVADALDMLRDIATWKFVPEWWNPICDVLDRMATAHRDGDAQALRRATIDLELSCPVRISRIGTRPLEGVPDHVLDRYNTLVHQLVADLQRGRTASGRVADPAAPHQPEAGDAEQCPS